MKKILGIFCITLLLGSCSSFLEEYSQDLSKVESYTDLDEVLLGEAYLPVGRIWSANSMLKVENKYFQTAHYMSDEYSAGMTGEILTVFKTKCSAGTRGNRTSV